MFGSNDIKQNTQVSDVVDNISDITETIEKDCEATVVIVLVEPRCYPDGCPVSESQYRKIQRAINRKLERELPDNDFLHFNSSMYQQELAGDGVHFTAEGKELIVEQIIECIQEHMPEGNDDESEDSDEELDY